MKKNRNDRLGKLMEVPFITTMDHRNFIGENGDNVILSGMSRNERRRLRKSALELSKTYNKILSNIYSSGSGLPPSKLLHAFCGEYVHRLASSGAQNFPLSFNFIEPFLEVHIIENSYAPYFSINEEIDHLFELSDFLDFITSDAVDLFSVDHLKILPEYRIYHFSTNGDLYATTLFDSGGREFVVSSFSMTRIGDSIHWYLLGGELLTEIEWAAQQNLKIDLEFSDAPAWKRAFLREMAERFGAQAGLPLALDGTDTAIKTIICGEFDVSTRRHVNRGYFIELENSFAVFTDDPNATIGMRPDGLHRTRETSIERLREAGPLWNIAEAMLQLPIYFNSRLTVLSEVDNISAPLILREKKGGRAFQRRYQYIKSLTPIREGLSGEIIKIEVPHFKSEISGHWRRLPLGSTGKDSQGIPVTGKTWVRSDNRWKGDLQYSSVVYIKDTISSARHTLDRVVKSVRRHEAVNVDTVDPNQDFQELYIMRCATMSEEVYKVGWTSKNSYDRAKELSAATGVPEAFIVVKFWKHPDAEALETEVHASLAPFRISNNREFFRTRSETIVSAIQLAIGRFLEVGG